MRYKLTYIKNIIIWRNVNWCGQWTSNYSLYELIFFDFVIDFMKQSTSRHFKVLIKQKNNKFIDRLKKQEYVTVKENLVIEFNGLLFFKLFIQEDYYTHRYDYVLKFDNNEFLFNFIFIYANIILFTHKKNIYILNNMVPALD